MVQVSIVLAYIVIKQQLLYRNGYWTLNFITTEKNVLLKTDLKHWNNELEWLMLCYYSVISSVHIVISNLFCVVTYWSNCDVNPKIQLVFSYIVFQSFF